MNFNKSILTALLAVVAGQTAFAMEDSFLQDSFVSEAGSKVAATSTGLVSKGSALATKGLTLGNDYVAQPVISGLGKAATYANGYAVQPTIKGAKAVPGLVKAGAQGAVSHVVKHPYIAGGALAAGLGVATDVYFGSPVYNKLKDGSKAAVKHIRNYPKTYAGLTAGVLASVAVYKYGVPGSKFVTPVFASAYNGLTVANAKVAGNVLVSGVRGIPAVAMNNKGKSLLTAGVVTGLGAGAYYRNGKADAPVAEVQAPVVEAKEVVAKANAPVVEVQAPAKRMNKQEEARARKAARLAKKS